MRVSQIKLLEYYSRPDITKEIFRIAKDREIVGTFSNGRYSKRPDILEYESDIQEKVKKGVVSFHCSVERWKLPLSLSSNLSREEMNELRKGWDLIIDIDSKSKLEHSQITAKVVCDFLAEFGIRPTVKFSGRRGFHIGISWEAFPESIDYKPLKNMYPDIPHTIIEFIRENIKDRLLEELVNYEGGVSSLVKTVGKISQLDPYEFVDIEKEWGSRHLFRMPYSLNEKSMLVSIPIRLYKIERFEVNDAKIENVKVSAPFLVNKKEEATELLIKALDWKARQPKERPVRALSKSSRSFSAKIPEEYFPPCIKNILKGLDDGRKRSLFTLISFLKSVNWSEEEIEKRLEEWNNKNFKPLSKRMISTQIKWHSGKKFLPANCTSDLFYKSIKICSPDELCKKIKNPVNYAIIKYKKHMKRKR